MSTGQISEQEKRIILNQILNSPEFHDSKRYQELLQYLINKSELGGSLKETEIAHDVFGKDSKFDPGTDPLIRSYVSNLRKKLEHYYLTTSDKFSYKIEIPKGQYLVKYNTVMASEKMQKYLKYLKYVYPSLLGILLIIFIAREVQHRNAKTSYESPEEINAVWKEFIQKDGAPLLIALGDYVVLSEIGKGTGRTFLRVPTINNEKELADSIKKYSQKFGKYEISEVTYVGAGASLGLHQLLQFLDRNKVKAGIKLSREITWDDIEKNNIIFLGTFKTLYKLDTLLSRTNIKYGLNPNSLTIKDKSTGKEHSFRLNWHGGNYEKNYSLIVKQSFSKERRILLLTGFSEVSVMDAVTTSLDPQLLEKAEKVYGSKIPGSISQFELISEDEGLRYNVLKSQIKHFDLQIN